MSLKSVLVAALPALALAAVHDVDVGESGLVFEPAMVTAAVGDTINFHFYPGDHSVAQSSFSSPCEPIGPDAIYSGFINPRRGVASTMFQMVVNTTDPMWLYCSNPDHCPSGMAMVVNPPSSGDSLATYQTNAGNVQTVRSPSGVSGGAVVPNAEHEAAGGSSASSSSMMASSSSAAMSSMMASSSSAAMSSMMSSSASVAMSSMMSSSMPAASSTPTMAASSMMSSAAPSSTSVTTGGAPSNADARGAGALMAAACALFAWALI